MMPQLHPLKKGRLELTGEVARSAGGHSLVFLKFDKGVPGLPEFSRKVSIKRAHCIALSKVH